MKTSSRSHSAEDSVREQRPVSRLLFLALPIGLGFLLLITAVVVLSSSSEPKPLSSGPQPTATVTSEATPLSPTATPQAQPEATSQRVPIQASSPETDVVAQVNDQAISQQVLWVMQAADRAMADLLGQPLPSGDDVLDRLVNSELVRQAAQADGFVLEEDYVVQQLQGFLEARGKSTEDLKSALAANDLSMDDFTAYFGQLLLVDQFSRTQAQGVTVSEYLHQLQQEARISFGPAADAALAQAQADASANTPQADTPADEATPEAPTATPMADVVRGTGTGQYAPLFELPVLNYPEADFLSLEDLVGKPTLFSFWTTWCGYCRRQTLVLVDAHARHGEDVQFVGINVKEDQQQAQNYVTSNNIRYPIGLDFDGQVASRYGVGGFPTTYFLDAEGRVVARYVGSLSSEQVESYLQQLLAGASP